MKLLPIAKYQKTETVYQNRSCICLCGMIVLFFIINVCNKKTKILESKVLPRFLMLELVKQLVLYV
jgi:hypothetical protein